MNTKQKAQAARSLLTDDFFLFVVEELQKEQVNVFLNSSSSDEREHAHYVAKALRMIQDRFKTYIQDEAIEKKRS